MWLKPLENTTAINYGSQAPNIDPQELALVTDLDNPTDGPAWHFQTTYDKIVVLNPNDFTAGENMKRDAHASGSGVYGPSYPPDGFTMPAGFGPRHEVTAGDTPWYCIWNQTFIEVFVYVEQNTSAAISAAATMRSASATITASPGLSGYSTPAPSTYQSSPVTNAPTSTTSTSTPVERRGDDADIQWYPRIVKIEERRMASAEKPYCQKMQLLDDGRMVPVLTSEKKIVRVNLTESDPDYSDSSESSKRLKRSLWRRDDPSNACHCQWSFT